MDNPSNSDCYYCLQFVSLYVSFWKNVVLVTCTVLGTITEQVLSIFKGVYVCLSVFLSVDRFCQHNSISSVQDVVTKLYRCIAAIKMKAMVKER